MFNRFMPKEGKFFTLFNQHASLMSATAKEMVILFQDIDNADVHIQSIREKEKKADRLTYETVDLLHKTFITPLDRDVILKLVTNLDDVIDMMEDVSECVSLYHVTETSEHAQKLCEIIVACCERLEKAVNCLENMSNTPEVIRLASEIERFESEADRVMRTALSRLFREETDAIRVVKYKAIYELLESITDKCEDVSNILQGIMVENA